MIADNTLSPLEIADAREAAHKASELQRQLADDLAGAHKALALAEFRFRRALTERIMQLHEGKEGESGMAITMCETVAKGEESIALLRRERDELRGDLAAVEQNGFRRGADRRTLDGLIRWSMHRDLRTDTPPADWSLPDPAGVGNGG